MASHLGRPDCRCWSLLKTGMSPEDILMEEEAMLQGMRSDFQVQILIPSSPECSGITETSAPWLLLQSFQYSLTLP